MPTIAKASVLAAALPLLGPQLRLRALREGERDGDLEGL